MARYLIDHGADVNLAVVAPTVDGSERRSPLSDGATARSRRNGRAAARSTAPAANATPKIQGGIFNDGFHRRPRLCLKATEIEADLIIIGGGLAGIAIAKQWAGADKSVAILESGGREFDMEIQDLYGGGGVMRAPGNPDATSTITSSNRAARARRLAAMSGAANACRWTKPTSPDRDWLARTGWPVTRAQIAALLRSRLRPARNPAVQSRLGSRARMPDARR